MLYGEKMREILTKFGIDKSTLPNNLYSTLLEAIGNADAGGGNDANKTYIVKDTKIVSGQSLPIWGYSGFRGNNNFEGVLAYTYNYQTFATKQLDLTNYTKACVKFVGMETYVSTSFDTIFRLLASNTTYGSLTTVANGKAPDSCILNSVTWGVEDLGAEFKATYKTLELDISDIDTAYIMFESCKCSTAILDMWLE